MGIQLNGITGDAIIPGDVGIGGTLTYEDVTNVDSVGIITARAAVSIADSIIHTGDTNTSLRFPAADTITAETAGLERVRILSDGRIGINTPTVFDINTMLQVSQADAGPNLVLHRNDTSVSVNQVLGAIRATGNDSDGTQQQSSAIEFVADLDHGTGDKPGRIVFSTTADGASSPTERLRIKSGGTIAIPGQGASNANPRLLIEDGTGGDNDFSISQYEDANGTYTLIGQNVQLNSGGGEVIQDSNHKTSSILLDARNHGAIMFNTGGTNARSERLRITSEGALLLSTAGTRRNTKGSSQFQAFLVEGTTNNTTRMSMIRSSNDDNGPEIQIIKTRGSSVGSVTKPNQNDYLGSFVFLAGDDSDLFTRGAEIYVQATGTPANDRCPSDIIFSTTPTSGASTPQEALRITSGGYIQQHKLIAVSYSDTRGISLSNADLTTSNFYNHTNFASDNSILDSNGHFVAPIHGIYRLYFRCTTDGVAGNRANVRLRKNGNTINEAYDSNNGSTNQSSVSSEIVMELNAGEYLDIQVGQLHTMSGSQHKQVTFHMLG